MRTRNHAQEYAARIARGTAQGLSKSVSRGHPKPDEVLKSGRVSARSYDAQLESAVKQIRGGKSLSKASASSGVSAERVRTYLTAQGVGEKVGSRWRVGKDTRVREIPAFINGEARVISVRGYENSRLIGQYMSAVGRFLETNDPSYLKPFKGKSVKDASGRRHPFETDPNTLYRLTTGGGDDFSRVYRIQL